MEELKNSTHTDKNSIIRNKYKKNNLDPSEVKKAIFKNYQNPKKNNQKKPEQNIWIGRCDIIKIAFSKRFHWIPTRKLSFKNDDKNVFKINMEGRCVKIASNVLKKLNEGGPSSPDVKT